jgi:hypothetical protein
MTVQVERGVEGLLMPIRKIGRGMFPYMNDVEIAEFCRGLRELAQELEELRDRDAVVVPIHVNGHYHNGKTS